MTEAREGPATAAIFHHPDAVESAEKPLAGRRTAGLSFLAGYARHAQAPALHCVAGSQAHIDQFKQIVADFGWSGPVHGLFTQQPKTLANPGTVFLPGPGVGAHAWPRRRAGQRTYSLCGITHTVSTRRIMDGLFDTITGPVEDWDAIICTSMAVRSVVEHQFDETETYLKRRFAARRVPRPQLPVIPLGIDCDQFARRPEWRKKWRDRYKVPDEGVVIMSMGRLSVFEKMHPVPLMIALERAARQTGKPIVLLMVGWFGERDTEAMHREAAQAYAPSVQVEFPDGRDADLRYEIWSAADIFTLPVDNIQETFGLAPIEAMAAGLPVVCSDWNGFRDTVAHGETGLRVRTLMSRAGSGRTIAERFEDGSDSYYQYLGFVHQRTSIDVRELSQSFETLIGNSELREQMGASGKSTASQLYDWSVVIPQYQALWSELNARRARGLPTTPRQDLEPANPSGIDPFRLYARYPSDSLTDAAVVSAENKTEASEIDLLVERTGAAAIKRLVTSKENILLIARLVHEHGPIRMDDLTVQSGLNPYTAEGAVLWLSKFDRVQIDV